MAALQLVGCGPRSGCIACPPSTEEQRLYFFSCSEVIDDGNSGVDHGGVDGDEKPSPPPVAEQLQRQRYILAAGAQGDWGMVDSLKPQWDKTGGNWEVTGEDRRMLAEYEAWLPPKIFDAHAHIWNFEYWSQQIETFHTYKASKDGAPGASQKGDLDLYQRQMARFCPGRQMGALVLTTPNLAADPVGNSAWTGEECRRATVATGSLFVAAMTIRMDTTYDDIVRGVDEFGYVGLKPYHFYSRNVATTFDSDILDYVSHEHCRAAHDLRLTLSIHMVKKRALADESNLRTVRLLCESYPNMRLVLCHSARGFNMHHTIEVIEQLSDLQNLYFDTGAVTEAGATNALLRTFGAQKVLYGSDWPVAETRGKCITLGDSFLWLTPENIDLFAKYAKDEIVAPALVGFETLRALKQACDECGLSREEVEDVFWNNAERLFGQRQREFVATHCQAPLVLPKPQLKLAEDYVRTANNHFTTLRGPNL